MPITKSKGYLDSKGVLHATIGDAQRAELLTLFASEHDAEFKWTAHELAEYIVRDAVSETLLALLTLTPRSKPKARKQAGTTSPKRARKAVAATPEQARMGFDAAHKAADETVEAQPA